MVALILLDYELEIWKSFVTSNKLWEVRLSPVKV